jgi:hypothetical protein
MEKPITRKARARSGCRGCAPSQALGVIAGRGPGISRESDGCHSGRGGHRPFRSGPPADLVRVDRRRRRLQRVKPPPDEVVGGVAEAAAPPAAGSASCPARAADANPEHRNPEDRNRYPRHIIGAPSSALRIGRDRSRPARQAPRPSMGSAGHGTAATRPRLPVRAPRGPPHRAAARASGSTPRGCAHGGRGAGEGAIVSAAVRDNEGAVLQAASRGHRRPTSFYEFRGSR